MYSFKKFLLVEESKVKDSKKNKKPAKTTKSKDKNNSGVSSGCPKKEAVHGGMSFYSPGEL